MIMAKYKSSRFPRATALVAVFALLLSAFGTVTISAVEAPVTADDSAVAADGSAVAAVTAEQLGSMESVAENGSYLLFADMLTGEFAVREKATGAVWYSNPPDRMDDPYSGSDRAAILSLMTIHCRDTVTLVDEYPSSFMACELENGVTVEKTADGIAVSLHFVQEGITVPLSVRLTETGVKATVDVTKVKEEGGKALMAINLLPYFGAGGVADTGYIVVPDGCGGLIEFNNGKQSLNRYQESVYGLDRILLGEDKTKLNENAPLPLFGIKNGAAAFAAIITEGDAAAIITAGVSKKGGGYNNAYAGFTLRSSSTVNLAGKDILIYEEGASHLQTCEVDYRLLTGDKADYTGMAKTYAAYLQEELGLKANRKEAAALFCEVYGAVRIDRSILGIPAKVTKPLTTFEQAQLLVEALQDKGVDNVLLDYENYDKAALRGKLAKTIAPDSKLGGKRGYTRLTEALQELGVPLISNYSPLLFSKSGNGFSARRHVAKAFAGLPGVKYTFDLATAAANTANKTYYLSPDRVNAAAERYMKSYDTARTGAVGINSLAQMLYSDFASETGGRQQTLESFSAAAATVGEKSDVYVRGGAAYLLASTDYIFDMADDDSKYDLVDYRIPLFQLAVSGLIPYSLTAVNGKSAPDLQVLRSIEYGADIKFNFTYEDIGITGDPELGYLNGTWYEPWLDYAAESYQKVAAVQKALGTVILRHEAVGDEVYVTTYEKGRVAVNYSDKDTVVEGVTVPAAGYALLNGGEGQ